MNIGLSNKIGSLGLGEAPILRAFRGSSSTADTVGINGAYALNLRTGKTRVEFRMRVAATASDRPFGDTGPPLMSMRTNSATSITLVLPGGSITSSGGAWTLNQDHEVVIEFDTNGTPTGTIDIDGGEVCTTTWVPLGADSTSDVYIMANAVGFDGYIGTVSIFEDPAGTGYPATPTHKWDPADESGGTVPDTGSGTAYAATLNGSTTIVDWPS